MDLAAFVPSASTQFMMYGNNFSSTKRICSYEGKFEGRINL